MPDHLHFFLAVDADFRLGQWVGTMKRHLARAAALQSSPAPFWQRGFFDHLLRSAESYSKKWEYVRENPVRAGLVVDAADWPFSGEVTIIQA